MAARCLIVDDEAPARDELRHLLDGFDDVEVVGEATTAEEARILLDAVGYDLVLLDVRMPGIGGLELARRLHEREDGPAVVLTTAYHDHAVEAFDLAVADYLVKPFDAPRLRRAVDRALPTGRSAPETDDAAAHATVPTDDRREAPRTMGVRIPVHRRDRIVLVDEVRVAFAEATRGYAELKLIAHRTPTPTPTAPDDRLLTSYTLGDLEARFSTAFVRSHRSFLVNLRHVREVVPQVGGTLHLVMGDRGRSVVPVARRQAPAVRDRLGV